MAIDRRMTTEEFWEIARELGAFWQYDDEAARQGRVGYHAELASGTHSNAFFDSKIFLAAEMAREIIARDMANLLMNNLPRMPDFIGGIPNGAKKLGVLVAKLCEVQLAEFEKDSTGEIALKTNIGSGSLLIVDDVCTHASVFRRVLDHVQETQPRARIVPVDPVVLNRGGLRAFLHGNDDREYRVLSLFTKHFPDWDSRSCPFCAIGSVAIKPKATPENWELITTAQKQK